MSKERQQQGQILYNHRFHELIFQLTYGCLFSLSRFLSVGCVEWSRRLINLLVLV